MDQPSTTGEPVTPVPPAGATPERGRFSIILALVSAPLSALFMLFQLIAGSSALEAGTPGRAETSRDMATLGAWLLLYTVLALRGYSDIRAARSRGGEYSGVMIALCITILTALPILYMLFKAFQDFLLAPY